MDPQVERITQIEERVATRHEVTQRFGEAGLAVSVLGGKLERKVALNTATIESFERTIASLQSQIDHLMAGRVSDV